LIELKQGDILLAEADALVNSVNCVGIMGRGIALQFRKAFPENYRFYREACERKEVHPSKMLIYETGLLQPRFIINFPTKRHWKGKSRIQDIDAGLGALVKEIQDRGIRSVAVPPLGCGLGGLDWSLVRSKIVRAFEDSPNVRILLFEPGGAPKAEKMAIEVRVPHMTRGRAVLIELMRRYLAAVLDPFVSLLEIHKLMYFMQEAGEHLNLKYEKGTYGPYARNLRHVLSLIEGHFITGFGDAADEPERPIELLPGISPSAEGFVASHPDTQERVERVARLIHGFETPYGMELLSTVHWVSTREGASSADEVIRKTYNWNLRKQIFAEKQIRLTWHILSDQGWLDSTVK
jgi:O-acetyl-ADP-ribose deacetylase (regulator of RNase III)